MPAVLSEFGVAASASQIEYVPCDAIKECICSTIQIEHVSANQYVHIQSKYTNSTQTCSKCALP